MRDRSPPSYTNDVMFNVTFVNHYKADIDGYSVPFSLMAESLLSVHSDESDFISLSRIDVVKMHSSAPHQMIFTMQVIHSFLLLDYDRKWILTAPEIFRGITAYADLKSSPTVALRWSRVAGLATTVNETKTSPGVRFTWRGPDQKAVATQRLRPYDSIRGMQFASLNLQKLNTTNLKPGMWNVVVQTGSFGLLVCMERKALRFLLGQLVRSAHRVIRGDAAAIGETVSLVGSVNESMVGELPPVDLCAAQMSPVLYGLLYECPNLHCSVFGFSRSGEKIPLHDHPTMHGFVTVLRGALKVKSFSFLDATGKHWSGRTKVRYEGERTVRQGDGCVHLNPVKGNIHEITALEDGSFFFDILVPGYGDSIPCTYFEAPEIDIREYGDPCLLSRMSKEALNGPVVLQLIRYRNVSQPKVKEDVRGSSDIARLSLTDGHTSISALLLENIKGLK
ncbi:hypothetical protein OSTOST_16429 [Ostertagia ostertagi]